MKTSTNWPWALIGAMLCCGVGNAQIIYSNAFNGAGNVTVNGTAPTVANTLLGGSNNATWICTLTNGVNGTLFADGTIATNAGSALLPFTPQPGAIYYLTAALTVPSGMPNWVAMGFSQFAGQTNNPGHARFTDEPTGYAWINPQENHTWNFFAGPKATVSVGSAANTFLPSAGTYTLQILLNTFGSQWVVSAFVNGTIMGTNVVGGAQVGTNYVYGANPSIKFAGLGQTTFAGLSTSGIQWNYWALSTALRPAISRQPVSAAVDAGDSFANTVSASADVVGGPLFYQWFNNDVPILGATNASLIFNPVAVGDAGTNYYVVVTNVYGAITSAVSSLVVSTNTITDNTPRHLASPDGSVVLTFAVSNFDGSVSCPVYNVTRNGQPLIVASKLGLTLDGGGLLQENLAILSTSYSTNDNTWQPVYGEKSSIRDSYNQLTVNLQEVVAPSRVLQLTFRAYNEGAAFCYIIPTQTGLAGASNLTEQTEFRFAADYSAWATYTAQGVYAKTNISSIATGCERPLTVQIATNLYVAVGEAGLVDYARMKFAPLSGKSDSLVSSLGGPVNSSLPLTTPWRFIMAGGSASQLVENNFFVLNLNQPCALTDTSWIKPGKAIRETTLKTASGKACVDFAAKHKIQYIEFDAGWYGPENSTLSATNAIAALDLPAVIGYAASNNVGVILYVNWLAMTNQLAVLPPLYHSWGVKGIKYGFVGVGTQPFTAVVNEAARICASNQMMLEVHDEFRPSGYTRTYPNFMTVEGVSGDETTPTTTQDTTLLFTRSLVGGSDHTVCYFEQRVTNKWSFAYQLAKAVCFYSPWQYLYWYDRPTNSYGFVSDGNAMITEVPEMEFYDNLPAVWDETRVLQGSVGQYAVIARRTGAQWFIGAMNASTTRTFNVPLSFLMPGQKYINNAYSQDASVPTRTHVRIDRSVVDSTGTLTVTLDASRGAAFRLLPAKPPGIQSLAPRPGGGFGLTITGDVSLPYSLWSSPDLLLPGTNWTLLNRGLITNNSFQWDDLFVQSKGFYRCSTP